MKHDFPLRPRAWDPFSSHEFGARDPLLLCFRKKINWLNPLVKFGSTGNECRFTDGPFAGYKIGDSWRDMPPEWAGTHFGEAGSSRAAFPLLVKFLFPADKLSVQVHPHDEYAQKH